MESASTSDGKGISISTTSSYDSITQVLSHAVRLSQHVANYFEHNVDAEKAEQGLCYATTVLSYAKNGWNIDVHKSINVFLQRISTLERDCVTDYLNAPLLVLTQFLRKYVDVGSVVPCNTCFYLKWALSCKIVPVYWDLKKQMRDEINKEINKYLNEEEYLCHECSCKFERSMLNHSLPLLSISMEQNHMLYMPKYRNYEAGYRNSLKVSVDIIPERFTMGGYEYILCGAIGRTSLITQSNAYEYVAYCRDIDGQWGKRDDISGKIENLTNLPIINIAQFFYVNLGCWDPKERKSLLERAKSAWYEITNILLPQLCLEKIFTFLDNRQLEFLINGVEKSGCNTVCNEKVKSNIATEEEFTIRNLLRS